MTLLHKYMLFKYKSQLGLDDLTKVYAVYSCEVHEFVVHVITTDNQDIYIPLTGLEYFRALTDEEFVAHKRIEALLDNAKRLPWDKAEG